MKRLIKIFPLILMLFFISMPVLSVEQTAYPDFAYEFLGEDKYENYNRKMFNFNQKLNKYFIRPVNIVWASIMPQYGMDRILGISKNIEFPIRFVSCIVQRDFKAALRESERFLINSTVGVAGMFDPAKRFLKIEQANEDMDQALAKCHIRAKRFFVVPVLNFTTYRGLFGKALDAALNPTMYIGSPILAAIKAGLTINRISFTQAIIKSMETSFPDNYDVYKTLYGIDKYAKQNNYDRVDVISNLSTEKPVKIKKRKKVFQTQTKVSATISSDFIPEDTSAQYTYYETKNTKTSKGKKKTKEVQLKPDILLNNYSRQDPYTDSMRTSLFYIPESDKSFWNEMSIWNRSFKKRIKSADINLAKGRENYTYRYLLQKDKNAPLAIIYPSTGAGVMSNHPVMFGKIFYDMGYSILIIGNPFQWEFVKSMPADYRPGLPENDAKMVKFATAKIIKTIEKKHKREFKNKVVLGTSYGALVSLYIAQQESVDNILGNTEYIAICPPVDIFYSINLLDEIYQNMHLTQQQMKDMVADIAAKTLKLYKSKKDIDFVVNKLPYTNEESKLLTSYLMHHKLADVVFVIENAPNNKKSDIYEKTNNMGYMEYSKKYLFIHSNSENKKLANNAKLNYISNYLKKGDNYKIYHSENDYLVTNAQIKQLKQLSKDKLVLLDDGAHLGFLYRQEFIEDLQRTISEISMKDNL